MPPEDIKKLITDNKKLLKAQTDNFKQLEKIYSRLDDIESDIKDLVSITTSLTKLLKDVKDFEKLFLRNVNK